MFVTHLNLVDFRSYTVVDVPLEPGVTVFTGANGQGKTNLVEAVEYLATLGSHRVATELPLVRHGAERARVRARVQAGLDDTRQLLLEVELIPGKANRASLNRSPLKRPRDLLGALRVVVFSPEDLSVVKGDPSARRRFLDELLTSRWPRMAGVRADYERVLKQRSTLLKSLAGRGPRGAEAESTLAVWDEKLAQLGAEIVEARLATLADLGPLLQAAYADIAPTRNRAEAAYQSSSLPTPSPAQGVANPRPRIVRHTLQGKGNPPPLHKVWLKVRVRDLGHSLTGERAIRDPSRSRGRSSPRCCWNGCGPAAARRSLAGCRWWGRTGTASRSPSRGCRPGAMPRTANPGRWRWRCGWPASGCCGRTESSRCSSWTTSSPNSTRSAASGSPPWR